MSKWVEISETAYQVVKAEVLYKAVAGGRMLGGGIYTEWTPHSAAAPRYPDLRSEQRHDVNRTERRYFVLADHI